MMSVESIQQHSFETKLDRMHPLQKPVENYYAPSTDKNSSSNNSMLLSENGEENAGSDTSATRPASAPLQPATVVTPTGDFEDESKPRESAINDSEAQTTVSGESDKADYKMDLEKPDDYDDMMPSPDLSGSIHSEAAMSPRSGSGSSPALAAEMLSHSSTPEHMRNLDQNKVDENSMSNDWNEDASTTVDADGKETYYCHLCSYSGNSKFHFNSHMNSHFEHHCQHCDYTSRTEGRLKRHIKDFHSQVPPPNYSGQARIIRNGNVGRPKIYRCKQCEFISQTKEEFWEHARTHIKEDKILQCPKCPFVTEYKHHLEYHLRNHFGSKPFKCSKCNYSCVNKSMLNSHMKSHTNIYQFRCADCTYATKYCHSLKLHLRKYNHKPASVLNLDGTVDETYDCTSLLSPKRGPPRGPRGPRKDKMDISPPHPPNSMMSLAPPLVRPPNILPSHYWPVQNGIHIPPPPLIPVSTGLSSLQAQMFHGNSQSGQPNMFRCTVCGFKSDYKDELSRHMLTVHARENQDLFGMFGINSEALMEEHLKKVQSPEHHQQQHNQQQQQMMERRGSLHVRTEHDGQMMRPGPTSWPLVHAGDSQADTKPHPTASLPELYSEKGLSAEQGMANKPTKEIPLDLTKPKGMEFAMQYQNQQTSYQADEGLGTGDEDSQNAWASDQARRNRRKGRAFKLDALCLKLQEKCDNAGELVEEEGHGGEANESETPIMSMSTPIMTKSDSRESQKDENHNGKSAINYSAIHDSLSKLNNEPEVFQHKKYRYGPAASEADERQRMMHAFSEQQRALQFMQQTGRNFVMMPGVSMASGAASGVRVYPQHQQPINGVAVANKPSDGQAGDKPKESYECHHCDIAFRDCIMYTMHMGYHGYQNPFKCNMCGHEAKDKVDFFLHIARVAHA